MNDFETLYWNTVRDMELYKNSRETVSPGYSICSKSAAETLPFVVDVIYFQFVISNVATLIG